MCATKHDNIDIMSLLDPEGISEEMIKYCGVSSFLKKLIITLSDGNT